MAGVAHRPPPEHVEIYGHEKFQNFVRTWRFEFPFVTWFRRLQHSRFLLVMDVITAVLGFASTIVYIISTYPTYSDDQTLDLCELLLTWFFVVDYSMRLALFGIPYVRSWSGILDAITILPILAIPELTQDGTSTTLILRFARSNIIAFRVLRAIRFLKVLRALRFARFHRLISLSDNSLWSATIALILTILSVITVTSGIFLLLETDLAPSSSPTQDLRFHDAFYFVATTLATIGYGDITPSTVGGKLLVVLMMGLTVIVIPLHSAKILSLASLINETGGVYYPQAGFSHVVCVVPGDYSTKQLHEFLMCLLHSNFRDRSLRLRVVVISNMETCQVFRTALRRASYSSIVHFISGSVHESIDLDRVALSNAKAVFVLSRRTCADMAEMNANDVNTFLTAISVKNYSPSIPTMVQINNIRNQGHVLCQTLQKFPNMQCICMKQRTMALLAGSCTVPALHTLVCNLLQSFDPEDPPRPSDKRHSQTAGDEWWRDYSKGSRFQTFPTVWGAYFHGWTFAEAVIELAEYTTILPFAMAELTTAGNVDIQLSPMERVIHEGELVYVLATDVHHAADLPHFTKHLYVSPHRVRIMKQRLGDQVADAPEPAPSPMAKATPPSNGAITINRGKRPISEDAFGIESTLRMNDRVVLPMAFQMSLLDPSREFRNLTEASGTNPDGVPLLESVGDMTGHVIVCGPIDTSLIEFVRALRHRNLIAIVPIVIVQDDAIAPELSASLAAFASVFQVIASVQNPDDLDRIRVTSACSCVLLADPLLVPFAEHDDERRSVVKADYTTIVNTLALENNDQCNNRGNSNTIIELLYESNLRFLRPAFTRTGTNPIGDLLSMDDYGRRLPALAAADGKIYSSGMLEAITAGSFFNPHLINVVDALIYGTVPKSCPDQRSCLILVRVPSLLADQPYLSLFKYMISEYLYLPMGLLRCKQPSATTAPIPFVFTNPPATTIVHGHDLVYVVAGVENRNLKRHPDEHEPITIVTSLFDIDQPDLWSKVHTMQTPFTKPDAPATPSTKSPLHQQIDKTDAPSFTNNIAD